jgi:hypothetical protein
LVRVLLDQGRTTDLRARVLSGGAYVSDTIVRLLLARGRDDLAAAAVRDFPERLSWPVASPLIDDMVRAGRTERAVSLLRTYAEKETTAEHRRSAAGRLADLHLRRRELDAAAATYRAHPETVPRFGASRLIERFLGNGRLADAAFVLGEHPRATDSHTAACLVDVLVNGPGPIEDAKTILRDRHPTDWRAERRLADLEEHPGRTEIIRAPADETDALVDRMLADGEVDEVLAGLRARAANGDHAATERLGALHRERAADPWLRSVDLLMNTLYDLRLGRRLDLTEWDRGRVPDPAGDADARLAAALRAAGVVRSVPGGDLPVPMAYTWNYDDYVYEHLRAPSYHWDARDRNGLGGYFEATVDAGDVVFTVPQHGRYPATPAGVLAVMAAISSAGWPSRFIELFVSPYRDSYRDSGGH